MVFRRFITFVLVYIFIFPHLSASIAHTYQGMETTVDTDKNERYPLGIVDMGIYDDVPAAGEVRKTKLGGRKMVLKRRVFLENKEILMVKEEEEEEEEGLGASEDAIHSVHPLKKEQMSGTAAGYIAFNADYHVPRPHPPKNN